MSRLNKAKPTFTDQFPLKIILVGDAPKDSIELTFSSLEEAEWKLLEEIPCRHFLEAFGKVLSSEPSSMDYPFNLLCQENVICAPLVSEDGLVRFIGLVDDFVQQPPAMFVQYRFGEEIRVAGAERDEIQQYNLLPLSVSAFKEDNSTLYYVWGNTDLKSSWRGCRLRAYELDDDGLHPALVFDGKDVINQVKTAYNKFEWQIVAGLKNNTLTKEQCLRFLCLSDELFVHTRYANMVARASLRDKLATLYSDEQNWEKIVRVLRYTIDELLDAKRKFGQCEDWNNFLIDAADGLCYYYYVNEDKTNMNKYLAIAKEASGEC